MNYPKCIALSGGVGGAKLAVGLCHLFKQHLSVIANIGDDFNHLGLSICPDIDSLVYALAGLNNDKTGWGRVNDTSNFMKALEGLGGETWFHLGDSDLAMHIFRTEGLNRGKTLTDVTASICQNLSIRSIVLPVSDDKVRTFVKTSKQELPLQKYFVKEKCRPAVTGFHYKGAERARITSTILNALRGPQVKAIIVCPSNPFISIDPIFAIPGLKQLLKKLGVPIVAVSPIANGTAFKGPTAKMMSELGYSVDSKSIAHHYREIIDGLIIDPLDTPLEGDINKMGVKTLVMPITMNSLEDKVHLAQESFNFAISIKKSL